MGDEDNGGAKFLLPVFDEVENLLLDGHIESSRRFVSDEEFGPGDEGHGDHDALAHAAGELVGVGLNAFFGIRNTDFFQGFDGSVKGFLAFDAFVKLKRLHELGGDFEVGIERSHGILEDHGDPLAPNFAEFGFFDFEKVDPLKNGGAAVDFSRRTGDQAQQ